MTKIIDPLWKSKKHKRGKIYAKISNHLGYEYHTAELKDLDTARDVYKFVREVFYA